MAQEPGLSSCPRQHSNSIPLPSLPSLKNLGHYVLVTLSFSHNVNNGNPWGILDKLKEGDVVELLFQDFKILTGESAHEVWMPIAEEQPLRFSKGVTNFQLEKVCFVFFRNEPKAILGGGTWFWTFRKAKITVHFSPPQLFQDNDLIWIDHKELTFRRWIHQDQDNTKIDWHLPVTNKEDLSDEFAKVIFKRLEVNYKMLEQIRKKAEKTSQDIENGDEWSKDILEKIDVLNESLADSRLKDFQLTVKHKILDSRVDGFERAHSWLEDTWSPKIDDFGAL